MNKKSKFKKALTSLCSGEYTRSDVICVVETFCNETKRILYRKETYNWRLFGEWQDREKEVDDISLDIIAPIFVRDKSGVFIELKKYFQDSLTLNELEFQNSFYRLINSTINQQSIRLFQEREPLGKVFYRSLRYILRKQEEWEKVEYSNGSNIHLKNTTSNIASDEQVETAFRNAKQISKSLTKQLEKMLIQLVENEELTVPIHTILKLIRQQSKKELENITKSSSDYLDPLLNGYISSAIKNTIREIDKQVLQRYESSHKLSSDERNGFKVSLKTLLIDFANGGGDRSYFDYLTESLSSLKSKKDYNKYRTQFEYVAKLAKAKFSAYIKADFNI